MGIKDFLSAPANETKRLQKVIDQQQKQIEKLRAPKSKPSPKSKVVRQTGKTFLRVFCGDSHGAYADEAAVAAFVADLKLLRPAEIIHVGDILEAGTFLAQHHVIGTVAQSQYTFEDDVLAANKLLDQIRTAAPHAKITLIEGNHDARIEKACVTWSLQKQIDAKYLLNLFSPQVVLNLDKRGIRFIKRTEYYDGLNLSGTIKLEFGLLVQHGEAFCGPNATRQHVQACGSSLIHGHNHRLDAYYVDSANGVLGGWGTGCLCQRRPLWQLSKVTGWAHGYLVQVVSPGVGYTCFPVPIIDGISCIGPLLSLLK